MAQRFFAVSDESQITAARFRSIAAVSLPVEEAVAFNERLRGVLDDSDVAEFKWNKLRSAKRRFCAGKLIDSVVDDLLRLEGRVDVLVWDTQDSRHSVPNRDDDKNFERMYFHLHRTLMLRRDPESVWHLRPDEKLGVDWDTLQECLHSVGAWKKYYDMPLLAEEFSVAQFHVRTLKQVRSCDLPICQVADLFAGMAAYTRTWPEVVKAWIREESGQQSLFEDAPVGRLSNADRERLPVIAHLNRRCKSARLGVSLRTHGYFRTLNPANPINFWHYTPQHGADRAPVRDA